MSRFPRAECRPVPQLVLPGRPYVWWIAGRDGSLVGIEVPFANQQLEQAKKCRDLLGQGIFLIGEQHCVLNCGSRQGGTGGRRSKGSRR
jgi:hypothetical protein